ncbi:MAG: hypothetical protein QM533_11810 [Cytophagales bacterium]|nr:hypothetical protein [Cytophagales bacterium]
MFTDIRLLGGKSLYYPYLDNKRGGVSALRNEIHWLELYSLFVDRIILTPSSLFDSKYGLQNFADLCTMPRLRKMTERGQLVTSNTKTGVRDSRDLFEAYSHLVANNQPSTSAALSVFGRSENFQRTTYSAYLSSQSLLQNCSLDAQIALRKTLEKKPTHEQLLASVNSLAISSIEKRMITTTATTSYFYAGKLGNAAITPPSLSESPHEHFDFLYSKAVLRHFGNEIGQVLKTSFHLIPDKNLDLLRQRLLIFREQYYRLSIQHGHLFGNVIQSQLSAGNQWRLRAPIVATQAAVATCIGFALAPVLGLAATGALMVTGKFAWEAYAKSTRLNDRLADAVRDRFVKLGALKPHEKDLNEALDVFRKNLRSLASP